MKKKVVFLSGAGVSAESGISTFRDQNGLWEQYRIEDVASIEGWHQNPELVNHFYNLRRGQLENCFPNKAHLAIAALENHFDITVVTQNVDDLHERAGSSNIIHLHGELTKICSENNKQHVQHIGYCPLSYGEKAVDGHLLRPFIVWFGEEVPLMSKAVEIVEKADILVIIGTSLNVYPAASLYYYAPTHCKLFLIDPNETQPVSREIYIIKEKASVGMQKLEEMLLDLI